MINQDYHPGEKYPSDFNSRTCCPFSFRKYCHLLFIYTCYFFAFLVLIVEILILHYFLLLNYFNINDSCT